MIDDISRLTMAQYVDVVCGDTGAIVEPGESPSPGEIAAARDKILYDFAAASDPAGCSAFILDRRNRHTEIATMKLFQIVLALTAIGAVDDARAIMSEYGINAAAMSKDMITAEANRRALRAKSMIERSGGDGEAASMSESEIRRGFDRQAATLMTYFKFQIDIGTIKASTFAYMIDQADREIKARMAALSRNR